MPKFKYVAENEAGEQITCTHSAETPTGVKTMLFDRNLRVVEVSEKKGILQFELTKKKVPRQEIMHFSRQLAAFIRAGVPILDALEVIGDESSNPRMRELLNTVRERLSAGAPLSQALEEHEKDLPNFYVDMIRSAELTGRLDYVLDQLSRYIERDLEARRKIRSALIYPAVILVMSLATVAVLTTFVLPRFKTFFSSLGAKLPIATRMLLAVSDFLGTWWWAVFAGFILAIVLFLASLRTERGRELRDKVLLNFPVLGDVVRYAIVERFSRILASMVNAGVPLPDAMRVVSDGTGNIIYQRALVQVRDQMIEGEGLSRPMARTELFPPSVIQMIRVGEDTGTLDDQLESCAAYYDQELDYKIKRFTSLFEPAVIVAMGVLVGFVAVALISAMYGIFRQVGKV